ncbi:hypothetical protein [Paenibacillus illinoisensis]|uniref:Uncharacterized protein n=1 Tax=Paenibacillus illinoisensis TaxID=59845 RepID=A0A2W0CCB6_9BACL|nr:hypothetical protein [Paenibacillus illinoisensis]PYY28339.1 hypothetical protein PIL02S_03490 [Paenibacillus illinoisensis]
MKNKHKGNHSIITREDQYYDGYELGCYDERYVRTEMKAGTKDCIEYIEDHIDDEVIWLKNHAQKEYYREPFNPKSEEISIQS